MIGKLKRKLKKQYCDLLNLYYGRIDYDFDNKPKRWNLINEIIIKKNYNNYLEIGCFNDDCFSKINIGSVTSSAIFGFLFSISTVGAGPA